MNFCHTLDFSNTYHFYQKQKTMKKRRAIDYWKAIRTCFFSWQFYNSNKNVAKSQLAFKVIIF